MTFTRYDMDYDFVNDLAELTRMTYAAGPYDRRGRLELDEYRAMMDRHWPDWRTLAPADVAQQ